MKLTISETEDVVQALDDYAALFCDDENINKQLKKLRDRFKLSLIKKKNYEVDLKAFQKKEKEPEQMEVGLLLTYHRQRFFQRFFIAPGPAFSKNVYSHQASDRTLREHRNTFRSAPLVRDRALP